MIVTGRWVDRGNIAGDLTIAITTGRVEGEQRQTEDTWGQTVTRKAEKTFNVIGGDGTTVTLSEEQSRSTTQRISSHWEATVEASTQTNVPNQFFGYTHHQWVTNVDDGSGSPRTSSAAQHVAYTAPGQSPQCLPGGEFSNLSDDEGKAAPGEKRPKHKFSD
jgi:hypothetical protein